MPVALEIVSPEKLLLSRPVDMVVIPASEGDMGVLPGHAPMIVMLRGGCVALYEGDTITDRLFVGGGFAEVTPERCTVLADEALPLSSLDRAALEAEARELDSRSAGLRDQSARLTGAERDEALAELAASDRRRAAVQAKLEALGTAQH